jgi:hypothetical protein
VTPLLALLAALSVVNGLWMLVAPTSWYHEVLEPVPGLDLITEHFVRDVGCAFVAFGAALGWAAASPRLRTPLVALAALFFGLHALLHVFDTARGYLDAHHWIEDLPGVYLPALLLVGASLLLVRRETP